jgi:lipid-A-disaccharide synthase
MQSPFPKGAKILIVSGEASGDQHGASLVAAVHRMAPKVQFLGMGGDKMRQAGVDVRVDAGPLAVVGAIEVLRHIVPIYKAWQTLSHIIRTEPLDLVVLIDYPTFNLQIARIAKKAGIKVLYYISPQVWAWHRSRIKTIKKRVDKMLVVFPFEEALYREKNVPVEYVGHPLADKVRPDKDPAAMRQAWGIDPNARVIGLLPGSRIGEIRRLLPVMLEAAEQLLKQYPDLSFVLPLADTLSVEDVAPYLHSKTIAPKIHIIPAQFYNTVQLCTAAIVTSGTATLETALLEIPMVIVYKTAASTYQIAKRILKIPHIGLCNIVADKEVVKELIQEAANATAIAAEIACILDNTPYYQQIRADLHTVKIKLGAGGGAQKAAKNLLELINY